MFPIMYDPMTAIGLLLGKDVDLFIYDTPDIDFQIEYEQSFPIFAGLNAVIKGGLEVYSDFFFGFDTTGIRSWFEKFEASDYNFDAAIGNLDDIFDGFFIADWAVSDTGVLQEGDDVAEVVMNITFAAGAALGIGGLVEAGVLGGIEAQIGLNLHDLPKPGTGGDNQPPAIYDGKIRFDEIATILQHNPLCLFDMEGAIKAFLEAYLWVGVKVFGSKITLFEASKRFVEVTIATFEWTCPEFPDPEVATINNGVMTLAYKDADGRRAAQEQYSVSMEEVDLTDDGIDNEVSMLRVTGNGHTEYFDPNLVTKIVATGTDGNDLFEIDTSVDADLDIHTGAGDDYVILTGKQNENRSRKVFGDAGDDTIIGTDMADYLDGGAGNDNIRSKKGVDEIYGGSGNDFIWADGDALGTSGNTNGYANYIDAGDGDDRILTGDGNDRILAGGGDDTVDSGAGVDTIDAGDGADFVDAGTGADVIRGGAGDDSLNWEVGDGADNFDGGAGADEVFMAGYQVNPDQFYEADTSNYIVDDAKTDTVVVSDNSGNTNIAWQHGSDASITLTSSSVETLSLDTGRGADDITIKNLKDTVTDSVKLSTGTLRTLKTESRAVKERNSDGDLVDTSETQDFKILDIQDDGALDKVFVEGTSGADNYLISTVESTGIDGEAQTAIRYEQLDGGTDVAGNPTSHVVVDVYDLEASDQTHLETLAGNDSIDAQGVNQQVVNELFMDGGADNDTIVGSSLAGTSDVIIGGTGSDRLTGAVGVDQFYEQSLVNDSNNAGDTDVLVEKRDAYFTLKNQQLVIDDTALSGQYGNETENFAQIFENAELTGLDSANQFTVTDWSGGGILDGGKGGDSYTLELAQLASGRQYLNVNDTGASGIDTLIYKGSAGDDTIQLDTVYKRDEDVEKRFTDSRWTNYGDHGDGLIIAHFDSNDSFAKADLDDEDALMQVNESGLAAGQDYQVVNYNSVEQVTVFGGEGHDKFISDGSATQIDIFGDGGDDQFYVGSVLETETVLVEGQEVTIVNQITDGVNFNGSAFFGGEGDDYFEVNHNAADIGLYGDNGDDTFFIKALLTQDDDGELLDIDSGVANVSGVSQGDNPNDTREVDVDTLVYVENANVSIDGGAGFDSVALVGTVLSDTFYVYVEEDPDTGETVQRIYGAGVKLQKLLNIERLQLLTGGGDDTVYLYGVDMGLIGDMVIKTGSGSDVVHVGGPEQIINLNFPKNSDLFYSQVEGFKVDQDAEGNFQYAGMVSGIPFYRIDEVDRVVPFEVDNPARTLQVVMPESYDINAFVSPVLIDGGEGVHDQIIVNNQQGAANLRFANTDLKRKEITFDYDQFSLTSGANDFVSDILADASTRLVAEALLSSAAGDYIRFQDRYYDTALVDKLNADQLSQLVIPEGLSYFNIQNTLNADGSISYARDLLIDLAAKFNLTLAWTIVDHPDPTRADPNGDGDTSDGEKLYELLSIKTAGGDDVAFEAQHKETVIYDTSGNVAILKDITALTLKTNSDLTVGFAAGAVTKVEEIRSDAMNTLGVLGEAPELHITGMNDITLNLSEKDAVNGSVLEVDNNLFGTATFTDQSGTTQTVSTTDKLHIQGGSASDDIRIQQTAAEVVAHGNDGDDTITVGKNGRLDQIGDQVYLFGDAGDDTIILDREQDASDADVAVDKNLLQHSTGFEQLSRITSALSLKNITDAENTLLENKLKEASKAYSDAAFAVNAGDLNTAANKIAEDALTQLLSVLQNGKAELQTSVTDAANTLRENDQRLLENQIKLYTRARYFESNNIDTALLNKMTTLGLLSYFNVSYTYNIFGADIGPIRADGGIRSVQGGFNAAEDWLRNFSSRVNITDSDGNAQDINLGDTSGNRGLLQQLLENSAGESDLYSLVNDALNQISKRVFTASEDGGWIDVDFKLDLFTWAVHGSNDNTVRAYAKIYDTLINDYIGTQQIYYDLLKGRGLTDAEINNLYNTFQSSTEVRGFDINNPLANGLQYFSPDLVGSVDKVNIDLSANILSHQTQTVINQINDLDLNRSNSFADRYDDRFDALIAKINAALNSDDYSQATLAAIESDLTALISGTNPYSGSGLSASEQLVLAPVYNQLAGNTENGLSDLLGSVVDLRAAMNGADFNAVVSAAAAASNYADNEALFKTANFGKVKDAYAKASDLIDDYLTYAAGQPDLDNLPTAVIDVLKNIKTLDRAVERFGAFVDALENGFDFNTFRSDYLANQQQVQTFIANHPEYVAYLQSESRFEALVASLTQDAKDTITLAALNEQQYQLLLAARNQAASDFTTLTRVLKAAYNVQVNHWWFWDGPRFIQLDYTVDQRYIQQKELVERLNAQVTLASQFHSASSGQISRLNSLLTGYEGQETTLEGKLAALGSQYEAAKDELNAQFLVLKELSGFAVEVIKARGPDQNIDSFADDSSLISEMISFYDQYSILDEDALQTPIDTNQFLTEVRDEQGNLVRGTTQSSVIFKEDSRDYTSVTSITGMTKDGIGIHVGYDDTETLTLKTGDGDDQVRVLDTLGQRDAEVYIQTNGGDDDITVSDENNTTDGITSHLIVEAGTGSNKLHINDIADGTLGTDGDTITMTNSERRGYTSVTGISSGQVHYRGSYGQGVTLQAGIGDDDITIDGVIADAHTTVLAGQGDDDITVTANTVRSGTDNTELTIKGELGRDIVDATDSGFGVNIEGNEGDDSLYGSAHNDDISGNDGHDLIIAGLGQDQIDGGVGNDIIFGDLGELFQVDGVTAWDTRVARDLLARVESLTGGSNDTIEGGSGNDTIIAGAGDDKVTDLGGNDLVFGDHALVTYIAGIAAVIASRHTNEGGNDEIRLSDGNNIAIGGNGNDKIFTADGNDIVLGDNGQVTYSGVELVKVESTEPAIGGGDEISLGAGTNTAIAGAGGDTIRSAAEGTNRVISDNGEMTYTDGKLSLMTSSTVASGGSIGGDDTFIMADGDNRIIAGVGGDDITTATGSDHILADNGRIVIDPTTQIVRSINSADPTLGGDDVLNLGDAGAGDVKAVVAGIGADRLTAGNGEHHVMGDHGKLIYQADSILQQAINEGTAGGDDIISLNTAGSGTNIVIAGAGADTVNTGNGRDYILADHGELNFTNGIITSGRSTDTTQGGNDRLTLGDGDKLVIGGFGDDTIVAGAGDSRILGDNGELIYDSGILRTITTQDTSSATGGVDTITVGSGEHVVMGGTHGDFIQSGNGNGILMGDNGNVTYAANGQRVQIVSELSTLGGNDTVTATGGDNIVLGGVGDDRITTAAGNDTVFGDNGRLDYSNGILTDFTTTDATDATGGSDTIEAGDGDNRVFGGTHGDDIGSGVGNSILMGDNGSVQLNSAGTQRVKVTSELSALGGDDTITARGGNNLVFGNVGDDQVQTGGGDDVIFGDNGVAEYVNGLADRYYTTDTTMDTWGHDQLAGGAGNDLIFGGLGNELIRGEQGDDKVVGDLGEANYNSNDSDPTTLDTVYSINSDTGGSDEIYGGDDDDVLVGGGNSDKLYGERGDDFISGDGGLARFTNNRLSSAETYELFMGGDDELDGGADNDILFGGYGSDLFFGSLTEDALVGEYGRALIDTTRTGFEQGVFVVRLGQGNLDLIASTQFGLYNDKLNGIGFTPVNQFTPLTFVELQVDENGNLTTTDSNSGHTSSLGGSNVTTGDLLSSLAPTAAGDNQEIDKDNEETDEQQSCYNDDGMLVDCAEPAIEASEEPQDAAPVTEEPQTGEPVIETDAVDGQSEQNGEQEEQQPAPDSSPQERSPQESAEAGTAAAIAALAGWKLASGERDKKRVSVKGFSELRHQQRRMKRWDETEQRFIDDEAHSTKRTTLSSDWEQALGNIKKH